MILSHIVCEVGYNEFSLELNRVLVEVSQDVQTHFIDVRFSTAQSRNGDIVFSAIVLFEVLPD